jgi:NADPH-dependent ferric siderophore reductase
MSTLTRTQPVATRNAAPFDISALPALARIVAAWKAHRQARAEHRLDAHFRRERSEHERFLSKAADHYELERLERAWEHSHSDTGRVF